MVIVSLSCFERWMDGAWMVDGDEKKFATAGLLIIPQSLAVSNKTVMSIAIQLVNINIFVWVQSHDRCTL